MSRKKTCPGSPGLTRRRAVMILAAAGAALPVPGAAGRQETRMPTLEWRGRALGGPVTIAVRHANESVVRTLIGHCMREIDRLENVFSLFRHDSELSRLNRDGIVAAPAHELRLLMADARRYGALSGGAFDVTIQPLWRLYRQHFARRPNDRDGPGPRAVGHALSLVDYRGIDLDRRLVRLARPGMAVSLNGIAQGYLTDRIAGMLRDAGMTGVLVDLGEIRVVAADRGAAWRIGLEDPLRRGAVRGSLSLSSGSIATSGGYGSHFDAAGRFHHLFDPATGRCPGGIIAASAIAPTATVADALATSVAVSPPDSAQALMGAFGGRQVRLTLADGTTRTLHA